MSEIR